MEDIVMKASVPILFAIISYTLYATQAIVLEQKLSQYTATGILLMIYAAGIPLMVLALLGQKATGQTIIWPSGSALWVIAGAATVFFLADYFMVAAYASAYKRGGDYLHAIVAVGALFPVLASIVKYFWTGKTPNGYHVAAYVLAAGVVILAAKGNAKMTKDMAAAPPATAPQASE